MDDAPLITRIDGAVARLRLNRPDRHNAFDDRLIAELTAGLRRLGGLADIRAIVLEGAGPSFSAGADLGWMRRLASASARTPRRRSRRCSTTSPIDRRRRCRT